MTEALARVIDSAWEARDTLSTAVESAPAGTGSGFVWDDAGHIVTNYHAAGRADRPPAGPRNGPGRSSATPRRPR